MIKKNFSLFVQVSCASTFLLLLLLNSAYAQGPGLPGGPDYDPDKEVPVDGGMALLLVAGMAYGIKRINANRS